MGAPIRRPHIVASTAGLAGDVCPRYWTVTRGWTEGTGHGEDDGAHRLLHGDCGARKRQIEDGFAPARVRAIRRARNRRWNLRGCNAERGVAVLDLRRWDGGAAGHVDGGRVLPRNLALVSRVGAVRRHVGRGVDRNEHVPVAESGELPGG